MSHFVVTRVYETLIELDPLDRELQMPGETDEELALSIVNALPIEAWRLIGGDIEEVS